jgi:predicted hotdog family 3-hydroxylacyl-ACP dehydratase
MSAPIAPGHPSPAALLRHRGPALLLDAIETCDGRTLGCSSRGAGPWPWPRMLEGAAQAAGLLAGMQPEGPAASAVIAQYRDVIVHGAAAPGPLRFVAALDRRLLHFWRCRVEVRDEGGRLLLEGLVTLAPSAEA